MRLKPESAQGSNPTVHLTAPKMIIQDSSISGAERRRVEGVAVDFSKEKREAVLSDI
jgi:hypothetical protein